MRKWGKQSLLGASVLTLVYAVWGAVLSLVTIPVMLHGLGVASYGIYTLAFSVAGFGAFMDFGLGWTVSKFVAEADAQNDQLLLGATMRAGSLYFLAIGMVFVVLVVPSADWIARSVLRSSIEDAPTMAIVVRIAAVSFFCSSMGGAFISMLRGMRRFAAATLISMIGITGSVAGAAVAAWLGLGVIVAAGAQLFGAFLSMCIGAWTCHPQLGTPTSVASLRRQLRNMLGFSFWSYMNRLTQMLVLQADKILIGRFAGAAFLPVYSVPFGLAQKTNFLAGPAVTAIYPTAAAGKYDQETFMKQYFSGSHTVHIMTAAAALAVIKCEPQNITAKAAAAVMMCTVREPEKYCFMKVSWSYLPAAAVG